MYVTRMRVRMVRARQRFHQLHRGGSSHPPTTASCPIQRPAHGVKTVLRGRCIGLRDHMVQKPATRKWIRCCQIPSVSFCNGFIRFRLARVHECCVCIHTVTPTLATYATPCISANDYSLSMKRMYYTNNCFQHQQLSR